MINNKTLFLLFGVIGLLGLTATTGNSALVNAKEESSSAITHKNIAKKEAARDYSSEQDIPEGKLSVSATSSTLTSMGQSFSLTFSTGGQGFCDLTTTYTLAPSDEGFDSFYAEFLSLTAEEREEITEKWEAGEYETPHFNSYVYAITGSSTVKDVVIPRSLTRNHIFNLDVVEIGSNAVPDWTNVTSITIPKEVEVVLDDSFQNIPDSVVFKVEAASRPEGWAENWNHGVTVQYGTNYPESKAEPLSKAGAQSYGDKTQNFFIGWYPTSGTQLPLVAEYKVKKADGSLSEVQYFDFSPTSEKSTYECVGFEIIDFSRALDCDIPLNEGEEIDFSTFVLHNIYRASKGSDGKFAPDTSVAYRYTPKKMYAKVYSINDFLLFKFSGLSTFSGFTSIDINIDISDENVYSQLKSNYYKSHKDEIDNGSVYIRYRLTSLTLCSFRITYVANGQEVTRDVKIVTPIAQFKITQQKGNQASFLLKNSDVGEGFSANSIREVSFIGVYVSVDLMGARAPIARSNVVTRFGYLSIMPHTDSANVFNTNLMLILLVVGYVVLYALSATGLYFYLKNKYKNDEFRRMKTKKYVTKSLIGLVGSLIVILAFTFIILRGTAFNNAIVTFNPVDAYIIVLSVISIVIIGYFIKYLVGVVKVNKERRKILKLKLNEDVEDDGTN